VTSNLGQALPKAGMVQEVAAWEGQIARVGENIWPVGNPRFGASPLVATIILTVMCSNPAYRSAMNIRAGDDVLRAGRAANLRLAQFTRQQAPDDVKSDERQTLAWGIARAIEGMEMIPEMVYDLGDMGKEAMIWVLGRDAADVTGKILAIRRHLSTR